MEEAEELVAFLLWFFAELGLNVNLKNSTLTPTQQMQFLGMIIDTNEYKFRVTEKRKSQLETCLRTVQAAGVGRETISPLLLAKLNGYIISLRLALPLARLYTRQLYKLISSADSWRGTVVMTDAAMLEVEH